VRARFEGISDRGQSLVEFALVLPLLLLLVFGIIDAGRLIFTYNDVSNAARSGVRTAIVNQSTTGSNTCDTTAPDAYPTGCAIASAVGLALTAADVCVDYRAVTTPAPSPCVTNVGTPAFGSVARVQVTGHYQAITPIIGQIIGPMDVTSTSEVSVERVCSNPPPSPLTSC
jgi:Flp pilus assembly protein TadG